jgi:Arc/MetJ family transcription regulator
LQKKAMPTNLAIDDELIEEARTIGKHKTKKAVVTEALKEYIEKRKQMEIFDLFGTVVYEPDHDYHVQRKVK